MDRVALTMPPSFLSMKAWAYWRSSVPTYSETPSQLTRSDRRHGPTGDQVSLRTQRHQANWHQCTDVIPTEQFLLHTRQLWTVTTEAVACLLLSDTDANGCGGEEMLWLCCMDMPWIICTANLPWCSVLEQPAKWAYHVWFHREYMAPEYFVMRIPRKLMAIRLPQ